MNKVAFEGLSFDDVLLIPRHSDVLPNQVSLKAHLACDLYLNIPVVAAGMDTVTETEMAVALARLGGIGFIHKSMPIEDQAAMVKKVKEAGADGAENAALDANGRLLAAAAVGATADVIDRVSALVEAGVDIITVDTAHGNSANVIRTVEKVKKTFGSLPVVAGNIATGDAVGLLAGAGADCVKVGMGPGSICTTRIVSGMGMPQISAIMQCSEEADKYGITLIGDGGIKYSGDITKAIAAGAQTVMLGSLLAGCTESPSELVELPGGKKVKMYRGMGSTSAMQRSGGDRYFQSGTRKFVPEGIEGYVNYAGDLADVIYQLMGGLRSGMGYCGAPDIETLRTQCQFVKISGAGLKESHPHDLAVFGTEPNYQGKD
ncbi:MAG: IMP dehydrogenase [Lachnospiraceae bacterium]|nr:IMP dehydrogenase [Lachnospiraceae bacterium]